MIPVVVFVVVSAALAVFQIALAAGAPWGRFAWGGQHPGLLPVRLRVASLLSVLVYALLCTIVLDRAGMLSLYPAAVSVVGTWVVFAYLLLGVVMNAISRSRAERAVMTPVAAVLAIAALLTALMPGG